MTILGIDIWVIFVVSAFWGGILFQKETQKVRRIMLKDERLRKELKQKMKQRAHELPPAYRPENWQRNLQGDALDENCILASTGCELTDAIYAAAHRANIDIVEFEQNFNNTKESVS